MAGRREKARQGGWNGAKAPYGYDLVDGKLVINPEAAEHIRIIFDKYVHSNYGLSGVARWMNNQGYKKVITTYHSLDVFTEPFMEQVISNHAYCGKIAYGKRKTVLREGSEDEYHIIETDDYPVYEGQHEAIVSEDLWRAAQEKRKSRGGRRERIEKDHEYIYSALLKCPVCGKSLYGVPMRGRKKKDGTMYPTYYSYMCQSNVHVNGIKCGFGQISCGKIDKAMRGILSSIVNSDNFSDAMGELVNERIDTEEIERDLDSATKAQRQALGLQRKLESELDGLDVTDKHYDRRYESLNRRLDDAFDAAEDAERRIADCEARLESVKNQRMTRESIYESLKLFDKLYDEMSDFDKKAFVRSFIKSIELYPDKKGKNGNVIKRVNFTFPISYNGESVYSISPRYSTTDENVVLLIKEEEK